MTINPLSQIKTRLHMRHLRLLFELSEAGSLRRAAEKLAMSQPAATKSLRELENLIGQPLFERTPRGLVPNVLGTAAIRYARRVLADLNRFHDEMLALGSGQFGSVRIGAMSALASDFLPRAVARIKADCPRLNVAVTIDTSDLLVQALERDQLDLAVARIPRGYDREGLNFELFGEETTRIVARTGHPQMGNPSVDLASLAAYPWIVHPPFTPLRDIYSLLFHEARLEPPKSLVEAASVMLSVSLLLQTDMISLMSQVMVEYYRNQGILAAFPIDPPWQLSSYGLITRKDRAPGPSARLVCAALRRQASERSA